MLRNAKSRVLAFLAFALMFSMLVCSMGVTAFAADEKTGFAKWWDSYNQIVGYCVAGVLFVAIVVFIYLWIPKKNADKKGAKKNTKSKS